MFGIIGDGQLKGSDRCVQMFGVDQMQSLTDTRVPQQLSTLTRLIVCFVNDMSIFLIYIRQYRRIIVITSNCWEDVM